jgi:hypothetical protein
VANELSPDLERLLWERIEGYGPLELLLLLRKHGARSWSAEEVALELKLSPEGAEEALGSLLKHRWVERSATAPFSYRYCSPDSTSDACVGDLARAWENDRLEVIALINAHAIARMRNAVLRTFSNAFKLREPGND